jgi:type I restriction enzyme R subunit
VTPEQEARANIDRLLETAAWTVQSHKGMNLGAGAGIAVRQVSRRLNAHERT